jgi:hypothetical protein
VAQHYNADGQPLNAPFMLAQDTNGNLGTWGPNERNFSVIPTSNSEFLVSWTVYRGSGDQDEVFARKFSVSGTPLSNEFRVNTFRTNQQVDPAISVLTDGSFVITYTSQRGGTSSLDIYAQRFDATGNRMGTEFLVSRSNAGVQESPNIVALDDGGFIISYLDYNMSEVRLQRYTADGNRVGNVFTPFSTDVTWNTQSSALIKLENGVLVMGVSSVFSSHNPIGFQRFLPDGTLLGSFVSLQRSQDRWQLALTPLEDGGFVAIWVPGLNRAADGSGNAVFGQKFSASGERQGSEFRVNTTTQNNQSLPAVSALNDGGFVVTWSNPFNNGLPDEIYAQRFSAGGDAIGSVTFTPGTIENAIGGVGNNVLTGSSGANTLDGRGGHDVLEGAGGDDTLIGQAGSDTLAGGEGHDFLNGGSGNDQLRGGTGNDVYSLLRDSGLDTLTEQQGTLDTVRIQTGIGKQQTAFFRDGNDLLISYVGTSNLLRVREQFSDPDKRIELVANQAGINHVAANGIMSNPPPLPAWPLLPMRSTPLSLTSPAWAPSPQSMPLRPMPT